jgi:hypothetical protein
MRYYVCLCKIPGSPEAVFQFPIKREVDVDLLIARTIEGSNGSSGETATGPNLIREENQLRFNIALAGTPEYLRPDVLGIAQDNSNKLLQLLL